MITLALFISALTLSAASLETSSSDANQEDKQHCQQAPVAPSASDIARHEAIQTARRTTARYRQSMKIPAPADQALSGALKTPNPVTIPEDIEVPGRITLPPLKLSSMHAAYRRVAAKTITQSRNSKFVLPTAYAEEIRRMLETMMILARNYGTLPPALFERWQNKINIMTQNTDHNFAHALFECIISGTALPKKYQKFLDNASDTVPSFALPGRDPFPCYPTFELRDGGKPTSSYCVFGWLSEDCVGDKLKDWHEYLAPWSQEAFLSQKGYVVLATLRTGDGTRHYTPGMKIQHTTYAYPLQKSIELSQTAGPFNQTSKLSNGLLYMNVNHALLQTLKTSWKELQKIHGQKEDKKSSHPGMTTLKAERLAEGKDFSFKSTATPGHKTLLKRAIMGQANDFKQGIMAHGKAIKGAIAHGKAIKQSEPTEDTHTYDEVPHDTATTQATPPLQEKPSFYDEISETSIQPISTEVAAPPLPPRPPKTQVNHPNKAPMLPPKSVSATKPILAPTKPEIADPNPTTIQSQPIDHNRLSIIVASPEDLGEGEPVLYDIPDPQS